MCIVQKELYLDFSIQDTSAFLGKASIMIYLHSRSLGSCKNIHVLLHSIDYLYLYEMPCGADSVGYKTRNLLDFKIHQSRYDPNSISVRNLSNTLCFNWGADEAGV